MGKEDIFAVYGKEDEYTHDHPAILSLGGTNSVLFTFRKTNAGGIGQFNDKLYSINIQE